MKTTTIYAAATLAVLVSVGTFVAGQDGNGDTSPAPRTVIAEPAPADEPCPFPYPDARCAPIPPAPMTDEERAELGAEYAAAWEEIEVAG